MKEESKGYKILEPKEVIDYSHHKSGQFLKQLDFNDAVIERLNDDTFLVIAQSNYKGLLVFKENDLNFMIKNSSFPILTNDDNFYSLNRGHIINIQKDLVFFEKIFEKEMGLEFDFNFSNNFLSKLNVILRGKKIKERKELVPILSILLDETFRRVLNREWFFEKQYSLNPFYIPYIKDTSGFKLNTTKLINDELLKKKSIDIDIQEVLIQLIDADLIQSGFSNIDRVEFHEKARLDFESSYKYYLRLLLPR
ncbi:hypothetical protein NAT51_19270 [Flavobacterium amniphilum]|uniref:hypothetical protein n=1 Tax=Flavobacterium amniphilum TaxID=1834035 RepID=UPI00202A4F2B|nr:hypothetical protein [Flavobacterium amniphilum]MCL9807672.1 hypothetical protein [Flavobacterium amniphilum]